MRIPLNFKGSDTKKFNEFPSNFSALIIKSTKCYSNEYRDHASNDVCGNEFIGVTEPLLNGNFSEETGLAVAVWGIAIIFLLAFFFGVILVVGMMILVLLSFHHLMSLKKSLKSQVRLLFAIKKMLRRRSYFYMRNIGNRPACHDRRHHQNAQPTNRHPRHFQYAPQASNSPFHPRNNTPVSSFSGSFSSHASLSLSDLPSVSSFTPSVSDDVANSEFTASSRVTNIHPVSGQSFQRSREEVCERECQVMETREIEHVNNTMHHSRRGDLILRADGRRVSLQNCPPITLCEPVGRSAPWSPKEYWL